METRDGVSDDDLLGRLETFLVEWKHAADDRAFRLLGALKPS